MPSKVRLLVGIGLVAAAVVVAFLGPAALSAQPDVAPLRTAAESAGKDAEQALGTHLRNVETAATSAAAVEPLRAALANRVDGPTLVDLFENEDWWRPYRQDWTMTRVVLGDQVATFGLEIGDEDRQLVMAARKQRAAAGVVAAKKRAFLAGSSRIDALENAEPVLVLMKPLDHSVLQEIADRTQLSLMVADANGPLVVAGSSEHRGALEGLPRHDGDPVVVNPDRGWIASRVKVGTGVNLWVMKGVPPTGAPDQKIFFSTAALLALGGIALAVTGRAKPGAVAQMVVQESTLPFGTGGKPRTGASPAPRPQTSPTAKENAPVFHTPQPTREPKTFGRYKLVERLGGGGMSEIYTAITHGAEGFSRTFVIKRLRPELARDKEAVTQFIDEARMQASLVHSNIVPVFDFGTMGDEFYMAQEYIIGRDLQRVSARCVEKTGFCLEPRLTYYAVHETLQALAYAHNRLGKDRKPLGLVHRDVSASNVLISLDGEVKLFDFGIAKANSRVTKTQAGMVKGNANFMSPEQARGQHVDGRSDLFALGLVMYFCLTNRLLYTGENDLDILYRAACGLTEEDKELLDRLPSPAPQILKRALAFDPAERYQSAEEFAEAIAPYASGMKNEAASLMQLLFGEELREEAA